MTVDTILALAKKLIDVLLVWALLYYILKSLRKNVKMILLFKGILIIVVAKILSDLLDLVTIGYLIDYVIEWAPLALIVIFQPEIRDALESLGRAKFLGRHKTLSLSEREKTVNEIVSSIESDPLSDLNNKKISNVCALGSALIGHLVGDKVVVKAVKPYEIEILEIK